MKTVQFRASATTAGIPLLTLLAGLLAWANWGGGMLPAQTGGMADVSISLPTPLANYMGTASNPVQVLLRPIVTNAGPGTARQVYIKTDYLNGMSLNPLTSGASCETRSGGGGAPGLIWCRVGAMLAPGESKTINLGLSVGRSNFPMKTLDGEDFYVEVFSTDAASNFIPRQAAIRCGNGRVETGEACDDGNWKGQNPYGYEGDGCGSVCTVDAGWTCAGSPSVCTSNIILSRPQATGNPPTVRLSVGQSIEFSGTVQGSTMANYTHEWQWDTALLGCGGYDPARKPPAVFRCTALTEGNGTVSLQATIQNVGGSVQTAPSNFIAIQVTKASSSSLSSSVSSSSSSAGGMPPQRSSYAPASGDATP